MGSFDKLRQHKLKDGTWSIDWPAVERTCVRFQSSVRRHANTTFVSRPIPSFLGSASIKELEVNWEKTDQEARKIGVQQLQCQFIDPLRNAATRGTDLQGVLAAIMLQEAANNAAFLRILNASANDSLKTIQEVDAGWSKAIARAQWVRDSAIEAFCYCGLLYLGPGGKIATDALRAGLKGAATYQDTGSLGRAGMELTTNLVLGAVDIGVKDKMQKIALTVVIESAGKAADALLEGQAAEDVVMSAFENALLSGASAGVTEAALPGIRKLVKSSLKGRAVPLFLVNALKDKESGPLMGDESGLMDFIFSAPGADIGKRRVATLRADTISGAVEALSEEGAEQAAGAVKNRLQIQGTASAMTSPTSAGPATDGSALGLVNPEIAFRTAKRMISKASKAA